jgi:hypothetical protein
VALLEVREGDKALAVLLESYIMEVMSKKIRCLVYSVDLLY